MSVCAVTVWQKVDFLISDLHLHLWLYSKSNFLCAQKLYYDVGNSCEINKYWYVKFRLSEKATKIWIYLPHGFDATKGGLMLEKFSLWVKYQKSTVRQKKRCSGQWFGIFLSWFEPKR